MRWIEAGLRRGLLVLTLLLPCLLGLLTSYVFGLLALMALVVVAFSARKRSLNPGIAGWGFLLAFVLLGAEFTITARQPSDVLLVFNFTAFLLYVPVMLLYARKPGASNAEWFAALALAGSLVGLAIAFHSAVILKLDRGAAWNADPVRLGDTALLLGFLALVGFEATSGARRWLYLLGPAGALATVLLTGARGALVAWPVMLVVAILLMVPRRRLPAVIAVAAAGVVGLVLINSLFDFSSRMSSISHIADDIVGRGPIADPATRIRFDLYRAGLAAFREAPVFGHGWAHVMELAREHLPEALKWEAGLPHLHNEMLQFAVAGGVFGVLIVIGLLALPIAAALRSGHDRMRRARVLGASLLTAGYVVMGLPDVMVGFEMHTALFVALTAALIGFCRDAPTGPAPLETARADA